VGAGAERLAEPQIIFFIGPQEDVGGLLARVEDRWTSKVEAEGLGRLKTWKEIDQGAITPALVAALAESRAVVADVRGDNPNVYYEIGVAHVFDTPVIPLKGKGEQLRFDIQDQSAIDVQLRDGRVLNVDNVVLEIAERLHSLGHSPSRTAVSAYRNEQELKRLRAENAGGGLGRARDLAYDSWGYLARAGVLARLSTDNATAGRYIFHIGHGVGEIVDSGPARGGRYEVTAEFADRVRTLVLPDERAYVGEPAQAGSADSE
jgi:hypothetical protein